MPDLYWGEDATAADFRSRDDAGDLVLAETADGSTVLLKWNATDSRWEFGGPVDLGGNDLSNVGAVGADEVSGIQFVGATDDAQSVIEAAGSNSYIFLEPGATHDITPPLDAPANVTLDAGPSSLLNSGSSDDQNVGANVVLQKNGNGDMVNVRDNFAARGILFDGQQSSYTGDGLVDAYWDVQNARLTDCRIENMAGHARVHDAAAYCHYDNLKVFDCGGAAIRNISSSSDGFRRSTVNQFHVDNCQNAILTEAPERWNRYTNLRTTGTTAAAIKYEHPSGDSIGTTRIHGQIVNAAGPGVHMAGHFVNNWHFDGSIVGCDGPAVYYNGTGGVRRSSINADISSNAGSVSVPFTAPLGQCVHFESTGSFSRLKIGRGSWGQQNHTSDSAISNQSANSLGVVCVATSSGGGTTADGDINLVCLNVDWFDPGNSGNFNGTDLKNVT